jgi:hypothetical protein
VIEENRRTFSFIIIHVIVIANVLGHKGVTWIYGKEKKKKTRITKCFLNNLPGTVTLVLDPPGITTLVTIGAVRTSTLHVKNL